MRHCQNLTNTIWAFACVITLITGAGCKQKIDGQFFVVTRSAENIKLGAVEVLLLDKHQVKEFLKNAAPVVESKMREYQNSLVDTSNQLQKAQISYDLFKALKPNPLDYQTFLTNQIVEFYPDFSTIKPHIVDLMQRIKRFNALSEAQQTRRKNLEAQGYIIVSSDQEPDWASKTINAQSELDSEIGKLKDFIDLEETQQKDKMENIESKIEALKTLLRTYPTTDDYLDRFFPTPVQATTTDADGRFSFSYSQSKPLVVFARSQREILNGTEKYIWLVDAPRKGDSKFFLNNNNVTTVDPDGYFSIRPTK